MKNISHFRLAIGLLVASIVGDVIFLIYAEIYSLPVATRLVDRLIFLTPMPFGIWLHSKIARYLSALFHLATALFVAWSAFAAPWSRDVGMIWAAASTVISVAISYLLLFSRGFREEFAARRAAEPPYKTTSRKAALIFLVLAAATATLIDIYRFVDR